MGAGKDLGIPVKSVDSKTKTDLIKFYLETNSETAYPLAFLVEKFSCARSLLYNIVKQDPEYNIIKHQGKAMMFHEYVIDGSGKNEK